MSSTFMWAAALATALAAAQPESSPSNAARVTAPARPPLYRVEYVPPKNPAHGEIYKDLKDQRVLEAVARSASFIKLPKPVTLRVTGCDGVVNAQYDDANQSVTFCYEYLDEIVHATISANPKECTCEATVTGPITFIFLHEVAHAIFDLLSVPVFGREEDAADQVAAYILLHAGKDVAGKTLTGAAWYWAHQAKRELLDASDFSDVHALDAQRYYNVLCLGYGADPITFANAVEMKWLPTHRAEGCDEEYRQVAFAVNTLIGADLDKDTLKKMRVTRAARKRHHKDEGRPERSGTPPIDDGGQLAPRRP